jgi:drug/metabolite transporter (DMT)-like permease
MPDSDRGAVMNGLSPRAVAILQAVFVTVLWATSWVLIKIGLQDIPALTFAGLRYTLAFLCLLPFALRAGRRQALRRLSGPDWRRLIGLGLIFYAITQGAIFVTLSYLPATTTNLLMSFSTLATGLLGISLLSERPSRGQWAGVGLYLVGVMLYFYPALVPAGQALGLAAAAVAILANSLSSILGRRVNRGGELDPLLVTVVSMGAGSIALLAAGGGVVDPGNALIDHGQLGHHSVAGGGEQRLRLRLVEPHASDPFGRRVQHDQQPDAGGDPHSGRDLPGRDADLGQSGRAGVGFRRHRVGATWRARAWGSPLMAGNQRRCAVGARRLQGKGGRLPGAPRASQRRFKTAASRAIIMKESRALILTGEGDEGPAINIPDIMAECRHVEGPAGKRSSRAPAMGLSTCRRFRRRREANGAGPTATPKRAGGLGNCPAASVRSCSSGS